MTYPVLIKNTVKLINTLALMKETFSGFVSNLRPISKFKVARSQTTFDNELNINALMKEMFSGFVTFGHFQSRKKAKPLLTTTSENRGNFH